MARTKSTFSKTKVRSLAEKHPLPRSGSSWTPDHHFRYARSNDDAPPARRIAKRSSRVNRRQKTSVMPMLQGLVLTAILVFAAHYLLTNPRFNIRQTHIDGVQTVDLDRLSMAASIPPNRNIFLFIALDRAKMRDRVMTCDPAIADASLGIEFPNTLVLHIAERQPYTVLHEQNGASYLMDQSRVAYRAVAPNMSQLPIVTVPQSAGGITEGKPLPADMDSHVQAGYNLLSLLSSRQIGPLADFREVVVDPYNNVNLRLDNNLLIKLGQPDGMPNRLSDLEAALTADPSLVSIAEYLDFTTSRYALMKKPAPLAALNDNTEPTGPSEPLSAALGH